jgi:hypothetical protein
MTVNKVTPTVSWPMPGDITAGTALGGAQLDATASVPGTFSYTPAAGTVLPSGAAQVLSVTFTPKDTTDYTTVNGSTTINVLAPTPIPPQVSGTPMTSHSRKGLASIAFSFNEALNPASASNIALYRVLGAVKKRGKTVYSKAVGIKSATYNTGTHSVTLNLAKPYKGAVQVTLHPGLLAADGASNSAGFTMVVK